MILFRKPNSYFVSRFVRPIALVNFIYNNEIGVGDKDPVINNKTSKSNTSYIPKYTKMNWDMPEYDQTNRKTSKAKIYSFSSW